MQEINTILVVDDDKNMRETLSDILKAKKYKVIEAADGEEALRKIYDKVPHLVLLDIMLPGMDGKEVCRVLKEDAVFRHLPVIMLTAKDKMTDKIDGIECGADDYIVKPFNPDELLARVNMILRRTYYELDANPLTRLPGNRSSAATIEHALRRSKLFAISYIDLDNFKAFNDTYGFERGDEVIRYTAGAIIDSVHEAGSPDDFIGHLGGDDFLIVTTPERSDRISNRIIEKFDKGIPDLYDEIDRKRGYITQRDRIGNLARFPIMTVSIVCVHNEIKPITHIAEVSKIAAELKKHVKSFEGSNYIKDRRREEEEALLKYWDKRKIAEFRLIEEKFTKRDKRNIDRLKEIIDKKEIHILFQPILSLPSQETIGYEALCRGPAGTDLEKPEALFAVARLANLTWQLDEAIIDEILKSVHGMKEGLKLFINIDTETLSKRPGVLDREFLNMSGLKPKDIVLEVTESGIAHDFDKYFEYLKKFRKMGLQIAIDDAGSGLVSLRDIAKLKPDFIKLDMSLIRAINLDKTKQNILNTLLRFSEGINAQTSAEGIETEEEFKFLLKTGVVFGQGFLFAKPGLPFPVVKEVREKR